MKSASKLILLLAACFCASATDYSQSGSRHRYWVGTVPTMQTAVTSGTVYLKHITLATGASSGTFSLIDKGTDCSGSAACGLGRVIAIAANTEYEIDFNDQIAPSGFDILATGTVEAHIHYVTQVVP